MGNNLEMSCDDYSKIMRTATGWTFCKIFHNLYGSNILVLKKEGDHGEDIKFSVTKKWLEINNASLFGLTSDLAGVQFVSKLMEHLKDCQTPSCVEAMKLSKEISAFSIKEKFPGSKSLDLIKSFFEKLYGPNSDYTMVLSRENGCGSSIDEIKPFIQWFIGENRDFWKWPMEEEINLANFQGKSN